MRLERIVAEAVKQSTGQLNGRKSFSIPAFNETTDPRQILGRFYEQLAGAIFDARLIDEHEHVPNSNNYTPDLEHNDWYGEVRAYNGNSPLILKNRQIEHGAAIQPRYIIIRHTLTGIRSFTGSPERLYQDLTQKTLYGLVLPFPLVDAINTAGLQGRNRYCYPGSDGDTFELSTCFQKSTVTELFRDPSNVLQYFGMQANSTISMSLPIKVRGKGFERTLQPFPVRIIE